MRIIPLYILLFKQPVLGYDRSYIYKDDDNREHESSIICTHTQAERQDNNC